MIFSALLVLAVLTTIGYLLVQLLLPHARQLEMVSLGYLLGLGVFTFTWFLLNLLGVPFTLWSAAAIMAGWVVLLWVVVKLIRKKITLPNIVRKEFLRMWRVFQALPKWQKIGLVLILIVGLAPFIPSIYWPVKDWDSIVLYDFRAKTFAQTGFMFEGISRGYFFGYPLLTSLGHTLMYLVGFPYPGVIHSLTYLSFIALSYSSLRRRCQRGWALFWTLVITLSPGLFGHAMMTYTNLAYTAYLVTGYFFLHRWVSERKIQLALMAALLIGLSTWTRSAEPFWLLPIIFVIGLSLYFRRWFELVLFPAIVSSIQYTWVWFEKKNLDNAPRSLVESAPSYLQLLTKPESYMNLLSVTTYFAQFVILPSLVIYAIFAFGVWLVIKEKYFKQLDLTVLGLLIIGNLGITFMGVYLFSLFYSDWQNIGGSAQRMSMFFGPLIFYFTALVTAQYFKPQIGRWEKGKL